MSVEVPRKVLHSKRSFGKYPKMVDSPAYDASEEDNDPLTDDASSISAMSIPIPANRHATSTSTTSRFKPSSASSRAKHLLLSDSDGIDSPTYDGDVESSTTAGPDTHHHSSARAHHHHFSSVSTLNTPSTPGFTISSPTPTTTPGAEDPNPIARKPAPAPASASADPGVAAAPTTATDHRSVFISPPAPQSAPLVVPEEPAVPVQTKEAFDPAALTTEDIQAFVKRAIDGEDWRKYKINPPPTDRPVRIYADGVYDLFHFGHALQLRQAKLSFPSVYLIVGVNSDELVHSHKAMTVMTHAERLEAVRHCRWIDEVVAEAPWVIDEAFISKYQIDYVAHDEDPYISAGHEDVYGYAKSQGKFIPTRRTPGVSTSELLERIVSGYRHRAFDEKLTKMGHSELRAEGSDYDDSSRFASRRESRTGSPIPPARGAA